MNDTVILYNRPIEPFFIDPKHVINGFQVEGARVCGLNPQAFADTSLDQVDGRIDLVRSLDIPALDIESNHGSTSYRLFIRDIAARIGGKMVVARLKWEERWGEEEGLRRIIRPEFLYELSRDATLEGGDCRETPFGVTLLGQSPRTNEAAHEELKWAFPEANINTMKLRNAHIADKGTKNFHLDVSLKFFKNADVMLFPGSFEEEYYNHAVALAEAHGGKVGAISEAQMLAFTLNMKDLPASPRIPRGHVLSGLLDAKAEAFVRDSGHTPHMTNLSHPNYAGGGDNCMTLEVPRYMLTEEAMGMLARQTAVWQQSRMVHLPHGWDPVHG